MFYVQEIVDNCKLILEIISSNKMTQESYNSSSDFQDLLTMPMLRICEIIYSFVDDFERLDSGYDWHSPAMMRNQIAHPYSGYDFSFVWDAAQNDVPQLLNVCEGILEI